MFNMFQTIEIERIDDERKGEKERNIERERDTFMESMTPKDEC